MHELEDVLLECQRVINSMHAMQLRAMTTIAARDGGEYKSEQVGLLLKWSPNWAADRVCLAEKVVDRLPASLAALERGEIDLYKVRTVHDLTMNLSPEHARQAKAQRCVDLGSEEDGMTKLYAYIPADKAVAIKLRVDKIARLVKTPQDDRTLDQRRADVVCDLLLGKPSNVQVQLQVTVRATMLMRVDDQPGGGIAGLRAGARQDLRLPRLLSRCASCGHRPRDAVPGGPTSPENLGVMCRAHHRLKQDKRWMVFQPTPGRFEWTTPSNRNYIREPVAA